MSNHLRFLALVACVSVVGCEVVTIAPPIVGSNVAKSEDRSISGVTKIAMRNIGTLIVKQSDRESLTVKGDDNIVPLMESKVSDGTLTLGIAKDATIQPKAAMEYIVEVKSLANLSLAGAATAKVSELDGKSLAVTVTGACDAKLQGKMDSIQLNATGASKINAADLACKKATVAVTGASSTAVNASETLDVTATGACAVTYRGDPKVSKSVAGASTVKKQ
jgi:hypothetical protein